MQRAAFRNVLVLFALVAGSSACSRVRRVHDCQRLARVINPGLQGIQPLTRQHAASALRSVADRYAQLSKQLRAQKPASETLRRSSDELAKAFEDAGRETRALAEATDQKQIGKALQAEHRLDALARREKAVAYRIDGLCRGP